MPSTTTITIIIDHADDMAVEETGALDEVVRSIKNGNTSGMDRNEDESYTFGITTGKS